MRFIVFAGLLMATLVVSSPQPQAVQVPQLQTAQRNCSPAYPDVCIPPPPPDLDCRDISDRNFTVLADDPHRFDGDDDGIGCES